MSLYTKFIQTTTLRRAFVLMTIVAALYFGKSMITMILLTFIFTFLAIHFVNFTEKLIRIPALVLVLILYTIIVFLIYLTVTKYVPIVVEQSIQTYTSVIDFYRNPVDHNNLFLSTIDNYLEKSNLLEQIKNSAGLILKYVQDIGSFSMSVVVSFVLSFFYMIERKQMNEFSKLFFKGHFSWFFQDCYHFANKFVNTFGVVMEAQFFIALVNTFITTLCLALIGFTQLPSLAIMIFLLSLIPVAGVIISCVPLIFIAYSTGGIQDVVYVIIVVIIIHLLESYVLNPKFMSSKTELPIFYTFVVLLVSERLFGIWGLIVGIPIFTFFLDILKIKPIHGVEKK